MPAQDTRGSSRNLVSGGAQTWKSCLTFTRCKTDFPSTNLSLNMETKLCAISYCAGFWTLQIFRFALWRLSFILSFLQCLWGSDHIRNRWTPFCLPEFSCNAGSKMFDHFGAFAERSSWPRGRLLFTRLGVFVERSSWHAGRLSRRAEFSRGRAQSGWEGGVQTSTRREGTNNAWVLWPRHSDPDRRGHASPHRLMVATSMLYSAGTHTFVMHLWTNQTPRICPFHGHKWESRKDTPS